MILFALILDIVSDDFFIGVLSDSIEIAASRPEVSTPKHSFDIRMYFEYLLGSDTLDGCYHTGGRHSGNGLKEEVNMILVCSYFDKMYFIALSNGKAGVFEGLL